MDRLRSIITLLLALAQIIVPALLFSRGFQIDVSGGEVQSTPIVPAEYAFAIWGPIFLGSLALGVLGVLPQYLQHPVLRRVGWLASATFAASILWMVVARFGPQWLTLPLIVIGLVSSGLAFLWAARTTDRDDWALQGFVVLPLALYAGWLSIATFANLSELLFGLGVEWFTNDLVSWTIILLALATLVAIEGILLSGGGVGTIAYTGAVAWGLVAIIAANRGTVVAYVATAGLVAAMIALVVRRMHPGMDGAQPSK